MAAQPAPPLAMTLLVDTKAGRVLYAEAGKDVVDFLFSLLALPLGAVTKLLTAGAGAAASVSSPFDPPPPHSAVAKLPATGAMVGSVGNLHRSVESLDAGHVVCCGESRDALLGPAAVLQLLVAAPAPAAPPPNGRLYRCKGCSCSAACYNYATTVSSTPCPVCKGKMTTEVQLVQPDGSAKSAAAAADAGSSSSKGYVRDMVTYTVMDDLTVAPMSTITAVTELAALGVTDISGLQAKTVEIGYKEGLALLKASLQSQTVLTDVFLGAKGSGGARAAGTPATHDAAGGHGDARRIDRKPINRLFLRVSVKPAKITYLRIRAVNPPCIVDATAGRVLSAEAGRDAVYFLFSLLTQGVLEEDLVAGRSIANLYYSFKRLGGDESNLPPPLGDQPAAGRRRRPALAAAAGLGFADGAMEYAIMDDLRIVPILDVPRITMLNMLRCKDIGALQEKTLTLGSTEGWEVWLAAVQSKTALTDAFVRKKKKPLEHPVLGERGGAKSFCCNLVWPLLVCALVGLIITGRFEGRITTLLEFSLDAVHESRRFGNLLLILGTCFCSGLRFCWLCS
ncbi:hypothetical protein BAE44_0019276 [Dichanthelium oligosanthes]|uniref:DUF674 domain-containing protein n=1 Tax=Dichanthelium oligosanthes TaxID=888268 RepID=A0A1E5V3X5_9POAL|nr:hypothetical protein BAE44_0019276 [Dichanthelium oligosanthes]